MRPVALTLLAASLASACSSTVTSQAVSEPAPADAAPATVTAADTTNTTTTTTATTAPESTPETTTEQPDATIEPVTIRATPAATSPEWPKVISLAVSGDTLPHSPLWRQAERNAAASGREGHDFGPMLAGLAPLLGSVDLAVCHLETPIAPEGEAYSTMPFYGVPAGIATALADAGYDRCSTASNHTADRGVEGIERTVDVLEAAGLGQSGMARTPAEILPHVFDVGGVAVCHLSYTWSYNGLSLPDDEAWRSALIDPFRIVGDARAARDLGAEVVIVSLHWGAEGRHEPTGYQRAIADAITAGGDVDLVVGHHAHVLQPIEQVNGTWVLFGLGNVLSNLPTSDRWPAATQDAAVVTVSMTVDPGGAVRVGRPVARPTWVDKDAGWVVRLVDAELARDDLPDLQRARLEASWRRTVGVVGEFVAGGLRPAAPPTTTISP
jgi:poly-gamma-glutamate synthesis protein (capsule biosynthesis protein)